MANKTATKARDTTMAGPGERCNGGEIIIGGVFLQCTLRGSSPKHLCQFHHQELYSPQYPTLNSDRQTPEKRTYHSRASQSAGQRNPSQAGASKRQRPVNNPSRASRIAEPSQPNPPQQQPASTSIQIPTPPAQSHRGRRAPLEPSGPVPPHPPTPTEASNTIKDPKKGLPTKNAPTPPAAKRELASNAIKDPKKGLPINNTPTPPAAKGELSGIFSLGLPKVPTTPTRITLEGIAEFFHEAGLEIYDRRNPRADDPIVMEICGLI